MHYDGDTFLAALPREDELLFEAAFHFGKGRFSPFVQYASRSYDPTSSKTPDTNSLQVGFAWWMAGHNRNLKVSTGRQHVNGLPDHRQTLAQLQIYFY
jgi:hypothetical protein